MLHLWVNSRLAVAGQELSFHAPLLIFMFTFRLCLYSVTCVSSTETRFKEGSVAQLCLNPPFRELARSMAALEDLHIPPYC